MLSEEEMEVEKMVRAALVTIKAMNVGAVYPGGYKSNMPDPVRSFWEAYAMEPSQWTRTVPAAHEVTLADRMLDWIAQVDGPRRRKLILWRANRVSWRQCGKRLGWSHEWCRRQYQEAMRQLTAVVKADPKAERAWRQVEWW